MAIVLGLNLRSPASIVVVLAVLLGVQAASSHPVVRPRVTGFQAQHQERPLKRTGQIAVGGLFHTRQRRQVFDFSQNAAPAPESSTSDTASSSQPGEVTPASVEDGATGQDVTSFLGNMLGSPGPADSSSEGSHGRGGLGDLLAGLSGPSDPGDSTTDTNSEAEPPPTTCSGLDACALGHQCEGGKVCVYNTTSCLVHCLCPPPYDDPHRYDPLSCTPLGTAPPSHSPSSPSPGGDAATSGTPCFGLNTCHLGHVCENGGVCHFDTSSCAVRCLCPPPYDDPLLYDQVWCRLLTTPRLSLSSPQSVITSPQPYPSTSTPALRPIEERRCVHVTCIHGYCNSTHSGKRRCRCDEGWYGLFCHLACSKRCGNGGQCIFDDVEGKERCMCPHPWIGDFCTELKPDPPQPDSSLVNWLGGSFAVGIVVLLTLGALFMFYLWRKRLVFALKVVYYFLPYADNDGRLYDAFVSYVLVDADESFVTDTLRPKLEDEMGFTLCLHQRDFPVGVAISDNVLDALENSRRFILILTTSYLKNEWARFEFQRAFHEMLKRKIWILPIILEDISGSPEDSVDPTLQTILESVALLKYPGPGADERKLSKFWKQMKLCMPKKKTEGGLDVEEVSKENGKVAGSDRVDLATNDDDKASEKSGRQADKTPAVLKADHKSGGGLRNKDNNADKLSEYAAKLSQVIMNTDQVTRM